MRWILLLCIQAALMAAGSCLQCEICQATSDTDDNCYGNKKTCSANEVCLVLYMRTHDTEHNLITQVIKRQCWYYKYCSQSGVISAGMKRIQFRTDCCSRDNCRVPLPVLPTENNTLNGLVCPTCYSVSNICVPATAMKCAGEETFCFQLSDNTNPPLTFSGCSSPEFYNLHPLIGEAFRNNDLRQRPVNVTCRKATRTSSLPVVNFLSCQTCNELVGYNCDFVVTCSPEHDACLTIILRIAHGRKPYTEQIKRCGLSSECSSAGTITTGHKNISKNTTCCYAANCVSPIPTLPSENNETNGIHCESCYYKTYGICMGRDYIACTGNATQCISYTTEQKDVFFTSREVFRGCAHPELCKSGNRTVVDDYLSLKETVICGIASNVSLHRPNKLYIYFPVILVMIYMYNIRHLQLFYIGCLLLDHALG